MRRGVLGVLALLLLAGLGAGAWRAVAALPPATIEDAVAVTLRSAGAPTDGVRVENAGCVPAPETCLSYIADVRLGDEHQVARLACAAAWYGCTLTTSEFGLRAVPVPDVSEPHPMAVTLRDLLREAEQLVRVLLP